MRPLPLALAGLLSVVCCADELPSAQTEVYFCQEGGCVERALGLATEAEGSLWVAMYSFTHDELAQGLAAAAGRGVEVFVLLERSQASPVVRVLTEGGVSVRLDGNGKAMHHKFAVVDDRLVATGSFNWTVNGAFQNDENLVVLHSEEVAGRFATEFLRVWEEGSEP